MLFFSEKNNDTWYLIKGFLTFQKGPPCPRGWQCKILTFDFALQCTAALQSWRPLNTSPTPIPSPPPTRAGAYCAPSERVCWLSSSLYADILILILECAILSAWYFAIRKWFNWSFRKKLGVFRGRRRCWTENQFALHEKAKVVRATLSATITLFTTRWYFCNIFRRICDPSISDCSDFGISVQNFLRSLIFACLHV